MNVPTHEFSGTVDALRAFTERFKKMNSEKADLAKQSKELIAGAWGRSRLYHP